MGQRFDLSLSNHKLGLLTGDKACPRCFYDHCKLKLERPKGPFPSLPNGMDAKIKEYVDRYRGTLPPCLKGILPGVLWDGQPEIKKFRSWQSNTKPIIPTPHGSVSLINALDDLLARHDGFVSPLDWKTRGTPAAAGYCEQYYQTQADIYHAHLKVSGLNPHPETFFVLFSPQECDPDYDLPDCLPIRFDVNVQKVVAHYDDGMDLIFKGAEILAGERPAPGPQCEFCIWADRRFIMEPQPVDAPEAAPTA